MAKQGKIHICFLMFSCEWNLNFFIIYQNFSTNFGEWPYSCFLYDPTKEENTPDWYIGGATLLAPGIVITGAAKVE